MQADATYRKQVLEFSARMRRELAGEVVAEGTRVSPARRAAERMRERNLDRRRVQRAPSLKGTLRQELAKRSDTTTLKALAKRGVDEVTVLPMRAMEAIVRESVDQALAARGVGEGEERERLAADAQRRLQKLLRSRRRAQVAKAAEEARRRELEERVRELTQQFSSAQADLSKARNETSAIAAPGIKNAVREVLEAQGLNGLQAETLEAQLSEAFQRAQAATRSGNEELLEKRLVKLNRALEESEQALRKLAKAKSIDIGVGSIYDCVQGLSDDDADGERKKELLALVFADNVALQITEPGPVAVESTVEFATSEVAF